MRHFVITILRWLIQINRQAAFAVVMMVPALAQENISQLYAEAQQAQASNDLATAILKYEAIIRLQPGLAEAYANLGNLYYQQGQTARASGAYQKAIALKPALAGPHFFLGVIAFNERRYAAALDHLNRAAAGASQNPLIYAYLGYTRFARSEYSEAVADLEKAALLDPSNIDVLYHLSKSYAHLANDAFTRLQATFPNSVYPILVRAHLNEIKENWAEASRQYNLALTKIPDNSRLKDRAEWNSAKAANKSIAPLAGRPDELVDGSLMYKDTPPADSKLKEAIAHWQEQIHHSASSEVTDRRLYLNGEGYQVLAYLTSLAVIGSDEDSYRAHQLRGQILEESDNTDGAIAEYQEALKRKPDLQNVHFAIGTLYWKDHRLEEALPQLEMELKLNPHHPDALYELGDIAASGGHLTEAKTHFLEALRLKPSLLEARYALEKIYTEEGNYDKSIEQLHAVLKTNASESTAHYRLAMVYRKLGRIQDANHELMLFDRSKRGNAPQSDSSTVK